MKKLLSLALILLVLVCLGITIYFVNKNIAQQYKTQQHDTIGRIKEMAEKEQKAHYQKRKE